MAEESGLVHFDCPNCGNKITILASADIGTAWCRKCKRSIQIRSDSPSVPFGWGGGRRRRERRDSAPARDKWRKFREDERAEKRGRKPDA